MTGRVVVTRGGVVESSHEVHVAVVEADGTRVAWTGDPTRVSLLRSAAKPFQALPLVEDGAAEAFGITTEELALCCASHNGEPRHLEGVRSLLARIGLGEEDLECGTHPPLRAETAHRLLASGQKPGSIHNNCSGKHAGMLALALHHGWPTRGYVAPDHPAQRRMLREIARWTGLENGQIATGTDGCGVVTYAIPLERMALAYARFAEAAFRGEPPAVVVRAMQGNPFLMAGTDRLCTAVMETVGEVVFVKTGAEGVFGAGVPDRGLGIALKVTDGAGRAADVALVRVLEGLGLLSDGHLEALERFRRSPLRNARDELVGHVEADFELQGER